ncbi:MAG: NMD3-related protein [Thermoplasmata archaeon]
MAAEFCVVCGRTDLPLVEGQCTECYAKRTPLVIAAEAPVVVLCPTCGARKIAQHWERAGAPLTLTGEDLAPFVQTHPDVGIRRIHWTETGANPMVREIEGDVDLRFRATERHERIALKVRVQHHSCPECSRRSGHYYTSILQLRGPEGRQRGSARVLRERLLARWDAVLPEARAEWRKAISWKEERPEGWDFFLTDTLAARALARLMKDRLAAQLKESATLWGRRHGEDVYRVTFCLRLPQVSGRTAPAADASDRSLPPRPVER